MNTINTKQEYEAVLIEIENLWGLSHDSPKGAKLDRLIDLVDKYESLHFPVTEIEQGTSNHPKSIQTITKQEMDEITELIEGIEIDSDRKTCRR